MAHRKSSIMKSSWNRNENFLPRSQRKAWMVKVMHRKLSHWRQTSQTTRQTQVNIIMAARALLWHDM